MIDDMLTDEGGEEINRVADESRCLECEKKPYVRVRFHVSAGPTQVVFCKDHAQAWWDRWKNTAAGQSATFSDAK